MPDSQEAEPVADIDPAEQPVVEETATEAPVEPAADLLAVGVPDVVETATADLAQAERIRCKQIRALCDLAGCGDKFNQFVDAGFSVEQTQSALALILPQRNPALGVAIDTQKDDPHAALRAEYRDLAARKMTFGLTEDEYVKHAVKA